MKFITEYDLRAQFNEQPFTDYKIEGNARLTPGARQFLSDRKIPLIGDGERTPARAKENSLEIAKLISEMEILEAEFLVITSQVIGEDIETAGQISRMGHEICRIKSALTGESTEPGICFEGCAKMGRENCCQDLGNCFEISDFHIQSANGRTLVQLNALRAKTRAVRVHAAEALSGPEYGKRLTAVTEAINQIINKLSQAICMAAGVKECRRTQ